MRFCGRGRFIWLLFLLCTILWSPPERGHCGPSDRETYAKAKELYLNRQYKDAMDLFVHVIGAHPFSPYKNDSMYYIHLCARQLERYKLAAQCYRDYERNLEVPMPTAATDDPGFKPEVGKEPRPQLPPFIKPRKKLLEFPIPSPETTPRVKAVQIDHMTAASFVEVEKQFASLKEQGVDTVIFRVFQEEKHKDRIYDFALPRHTSGVYFYSSQLQVVDDILGDAALLAHEQGLKLFAWMNTRKAYYGLPQDAALLATKFDLAKKRLVTGSGLNLYNNRVIAILNTVYRELASYPIDGILIQDDLVFYHNEDFSPDACQAYREAFGKELDPADMYQGIYATYGGRYYVSRYEPAFWQWCRWKSGKLAEVAANLITESRKFNADLKFAINVYYEMALNPKNALCWYAQTLEQMVQTGFDYYAVMGYHRQIQEEKRVAGAELQAVIERIAGGLTEQISYPQQIIFKIQVADWRTLEPISADELQPVVAGLPRDAKSRFSFAFVPYHPQTSSDFISQF